MDLDPDNPVVQLCAQGMEAEATDGPEAARALYERAWAARRDDVDACIAAHYLARPQSSPEDTLRWNALALQHADAAAPERVSDFYPSLYLNLARSHEELGETERARALYGLAAERAATLPGDGYGALVRRGAAAGRARTAAGT